jgi:NAD(P)-dependent dehydrogenase (short-subunit alcohol dehydrogenase family)
VRHRRRSRRNGGIDRTRRQLASPSGVWDLTEPDGPTRFVAEAISAYGGLDILVNNVGAVQPRVNGFMSIADADWSSTFAVNFFAAVRTTRAALPWLLERGAGSIVAICSINSFLPDPLVMDYSAAKAALANVCKALPKEVGRSAYGSTW